MVVNDLVYKYAKEMSFKKAAIIDEMVKDNVPAWILRLCVYFNSSKVFTKMGYELEVKEDFLELATQVKLKKRGKVIAQRIIKMKLNLKDEIL